MAVVDVQNEVDKLIAEYEKEHGAVTGDALSALKLKLTPKAKAIVAKAAHKANLTTLIDFAKKYASADQEPEVTAAVTALTAVVKSTRTVLSKNGKVTPRGVIAEFFTKVGDTATESEIFAKYRLGRGDMKTTIKVALKSYAADERKWIKFDVENETYTLEAIGANPPADWTGYMPLNKK